MSNFVETRRPAARRRGHAFTLAFTLVELMVVVGIIAVLIAVLIPVIASVRGRAYDADTKNWIQQLTGAIERYQSDYRAYPGPLADTQITAGYLSPIFTTGFVCNSSSGSFSTALNVTRITAAENLVLGLLGGLKVDPANPTQLIYDPSQVGLGPMSLNLQNPKRGNPYLDQTSLSWRTQDGEKTGLFRDGTGFANDSIIPEFVDKYPNSELPILYLRARRGVPTPTAAPSPMNNAVVTFGAPTPIARVGTYDLAQIIGYTATPIGEGKRIKGSDYVNTASTTISYPNSPHGLQTVNPAKKLDPNAGTNYQYPFDAYPYFASPQMPNTARNKDSYILISAGPDRTYGTRDDIVSFGTVGE